MKRFMLIYALITEYSFMLTCKTFTLNNQKEGERKMQDVKNKAGEILGSYELTSITKPDTYEVTCVNKDGQEIPKSVEVTKEGILQLATQQFNTNVRNYVAGLAREKKDTKIALLKEYIRSKGIDVSLPTDELKKELGL